MGKMVKKIKFIKTNKFKFIHIIYNYKEITDQHCGSNLSDRKLISRKS